MNGLELMKKFNATRPKIFCLIMTGYPTVDPAFQSVVDGASDYIVKPFQLKKLLNTICSYILVLRN